MAPQLLVAWSKYPYWIPIWIWIGFGLDYGHICCQLIPFAVYCWQMSATGTVNKKSLSYILPITPPNCPRLLARFNDVADLRSAIIDFFLPTISCSALFSPILPNSPVPFPYLLAHFCQPCHLQQCPKVVPLSLRVCEKQITF